MELIKNKVFDLQSKIFFDLVFVSTIGIFTIQSWQLRAHIKQ